MREQIWLSERIRDIMHLKRQSLRSLFQKFEMNSAMELQRYLDGKLAITPAVLENIANGFGVSLDRLQEYDTEKLHERLDVLLKSGRHNPEAQQLAKSLVSKSIGAKEKAIAFGKLGWAFYHNNQLSEAKDAWDKAYKIATKTDRRTKQTLDSDLLFRATNDLAIYYIEIKEYEIAKEILSDSQAFFIDDSAKLARIHQSLGVCLYKLGHKSTAKDYYRISCNGYIAAGDFTNAGRAQLNLADVEFHEGRYEEALSLLRNARRNLGNDTLLMRSIADKDLARLLVVLGNITEALHIVEERLEKIGSEEAHIRHEVLGKLLLLRSDLTQNPVYADQILFMRNISEQLKCSAADILVGIYLKNGDADLGFKYYSVVKQHASEGVCDYKIGEWF